MLKIGVLLPGEAGQLGEFLADARALDTAGAHALWLDEGTQDPWMLAAALATVTSRARLGLTVAPGADVAALAPRLRTLQALSKDRAELRGSAASLGAAARLARTVERCRLFGAMDHGDGWTGTAGVVDGLVLAGAEPAEDRARFDRARTLVGAPSSSTPVECWVRIKLPEDQAGWRRTVAAYTAAGVDGLLVSLDARLVDLLRRFDEEDDRSDLTLAQG